MAVSLNALLVILQEINPRRWLTRLKMGRRQISEKHAGFIVNIDHATATDYVELIAHIQEVIKEKFDVELQTEVRIIGEEV